MFFKTITKIFCLFKVCDVEQNHCLKKSKQFFISSFNKTKKLLLKMNLLTVVQVHLLELHQSSFLYSKWQV